MQPFTVISLLNPGGGGVPSFFDGGLNREEGLLVGGYFK